MAQLMLEELPEIEEQMRNVPGGSPFLARSV
jgi:hypothetical protein